MVSRSSPLGADRSSDIAPHEHEAPEITGVFNFLRALNALITGDVTIEGFVRTAKEGRRIEIRPDSGTGSGPALQWFTDVAGEAGFIEARDLGGGVEALVIDAPGSDNATLFLRDDDKLFLVIDSAEALIVEKDKVLFRDGSAAAPSIARNADSTLGISFAAGAIVISVGGVEVARFTADGISRGNEPAYLFKETVYYTANGTFAKADYPGLRAVRVTVVGGGGGGGGTEATAAGEVAAGGGGTSGGTVRKLVLASALAASETVTVGAGGTGRTGLSGNNGGDSSFGTHAVAAGGLGGGFGVNGAAAQTSGTQAAVGASSGDEVVIGGSGGAGSGVGGNFAVGGHGGASTHGGGGRGVASNRDGAPGLDYGGAGGGSASGSSQSARPGGDGADGSIAVDVYV